MIYFCVYVCAYVRVLASDRLHNIRPWWWDKMDIQMTPPKHRSIDERMIKYKGRYFASKTIYAKWTCQERSQGIQQYLYKNRATFLTPTFPNFSVYFFSHINHVHLSICVLKKHLSVSLSRDSHTNRTVRSSFMPSRTAKSS